jgi:hypothetical protein
LSQTVTLGQYGKHFQECCVQAFLSDPQWAQQMLEVFDVEYLELKYLKFLSTKYFDYAKKYKVFPTMMLLLTIVRDELKIGTDVDLREQIIDNLQGKSTSIGNKDYEADLAKNNKEPSQTMEEFNSNEPMAAMPGEGYSYI